MRVLFDGRPARTCRTGIGRYASTLSGLLRRGVAGHSCWSLGSDVALAAAGPIEEELELPALLEREGVDLFHSPLFHLPALLPCKALVTIHDAIPVVRPDLATEAFRELFDSAGDAAQRAEGVVCPSEHARDELASALDLPLEKLHVVPEAPAACFQPLPEAEARQLLGDRAPRGTFLLVVGAVEPRKNPLVVLDALSRLPEADRPAVVFAGPEAGIDVEAAADERGLGEWVHALGAVSDAELVALYNLAAALVFPSLYEGFGLPPVEAFAVGTPVIASHAASIPGVTGSAALLFDPTDAEALAECIGQLLGSLDLRRDLIERGAERLACYTPEVVRERLAEVYDMIGGQA